MPKGGSVGLFIRDYLLEKGKASAYELWKAWKKYKEERGLKAPTYQTFHDYIYRLRKLGLVYEVGTAPSKGRFPRKLLAVVPGKEDSPDWVALQSAYREKFGGEGVEGGGVS